MSIYIRKNLFTMKNDQWGGHKKPFFNLLSAASLKFGNWLENEIGKVSAHLEGLNLYLIEVKVWKKSDFLLKNAVFPSLNGYN